MGSHSRPGSAGPRPRVVVVGGHRSLVVDEGWWPLLDALRKQQGFDRVWHGARGGADHGVAAWAEARGMEVVAFPAPVELYRASGLSESEAELRRNDDMLRAWGGYRERGGSIVPCARAGGFAQMVLALAPDDDTRDLVDRARQWRSLRVIELWPPRRQWRVRGPRVDAELTTLGDVVVEADLPLRWAVGQTRAQLRQNFARRGWRAHGIGVPCHQSEGPRPREDAAQ
ncbi:MAG: SLOG family protein [Myxococcota bacterium]